MTEGNSLDDLLNKPAEASQETEAPKPEEMGDKETEAAPPADLEAQQTQAEPTVPRKALEDERKKRQELERRMKEFEEKFAQPARPPVPQQPQPQVQIPDPVMEPERYAAFVIQTTQTQYLNRELNRSEKRARRTHGDEVVDAAFKLAAAKGEAAKFIHEDDAYDAMVDWYKKQTALEEIGDPVSYREKLRAELLAELQGQQQQAQKPRAQVPKSLATATNAQPRDKAGRFANEGPTPLEDIIG